MCEGKLYFEIAMIMETIVLGLCLSILIITIIYQRKRKKLVIKSNSKEKGLDDYSFRDLFHFFVNEEFHADKFHLGKGSAQKVFDLNKCLYFFRI
jgi:hypothetical protein